MNIKAITEYRLVSLRISSYHFNPGVFSTLITVALLYTMTSLAFWQMGRAEFKDTLQQKIIERKNLSPVTIVELPTSRESRRYHPVKFIGEFDNQHSFLLDNITFNGHVGYHVFTPVKVNDAITILVNRGFVSQGKTRDQLPEVDVPGGEIEISGLLDFSPSRTLLLAEDVQEMSRWPVVLQYIDLTEINNGVSKIEPMVWVEKQTFKYIIPGSMISAMSVKHDKSYKLPVYTSQHPYFLDKTGTY